MSFQCVRIACRLEECVLKNNQSFEWKLLLIFNRLRKWAKYSISIRRLVIMTGRFKVASMCIRDCQHACPNYIWQLIDNNWFFSALKPYSSFSLSLLYFCQTELDDSNLNLLSRLPLSCFTIQLSCTDFSIRKRRVGTMYCCSLYESNIFFLSTLHIYKIKLHERTQARTSN